MSRNYKIMLLCIVILISLAGGGLGGILVRSYLLNSSFDLPLFGEINLGGNFQGGNFIISEPKNVIVEQDLRISEVIEQGRKSIVSLYSKKDTKLEAGALNLTKFYAPKEKLGEGLILTSDGWIMTSIKLDHLNLFVAVSDEREILEPEDIVYDAVSGYTFIKVKARNLSAVRFGDKKNINNGQILIALNNDHNTIIRVADKRYNERTGLVKSSENFYHLIKISSNLKTGEIVFNLTGEVVGFGFGESRIEPINNFFGIIAEILNNGSMSRPVLGVNYIEVSELIGEEKFAGALLAKDDRGVAILKDSPAQKAGLRMGDIILEVDGTKVDKDNLLSDIIQNHQAGNEINLTVIRDSEQMNIKVILE